MITWNSFLWCHLSGVIYSSASNWEVQLFGTFWWFDIYIYIWVSFNLVQKITKHFPKWRYSPNIKLYEYGLCKGENPLRLFWPAMFGTWVSQTKRPYGFSQVGVVLPYHFPSGRSPTLDSIIKASPSPWVGPVSLVSNHPRLVQVCVNDMSLMQGTPSTRINSHDWIMMVQWHWSITCLLVSLDFLSQIFEVKMTPQHKQDWSTIILLRIPKKW